MAETGVDKPEDARELAIARLKIKRDFKGQLAAGIFAVLVCIAIWAIGGGGWFWPMWVIFGVAVGLIALGWKAYGPVNRISEDDVQREIRKMQDGS